jgi:hypothetical protein
MKAVSKDVVSGNSPTDAVELLVAELRARSKRLQQLLRLVNQQAERDLRVMGIRRARPLTWYKCRGTSTPVAIPERNLAGPA